MEQYVQRNLGKLVKLSASQKTELEKIESQAIARFEGQLNDLESALGMLRLGHHFGWKVLYLIHSKQTIRKYEGILGTRVRDLFKEDGPSSERSRGFLVARKLSNFWKIISGAQKIEDRREIGH